MTLVVIHVTSLTLICVLMTYIPVESSGIPTDYCAGDKFSPECSEGSVILIQSAIYGLMRTGSCIGRAYGFETCQSNQLGFLDKQCSGLVKCEISVGSREMKDSTECPKEFASYLEASYTCQKVYQPPDPQCTSTLPLEVKGPPVYLASSVALETTCGLTDAPILLQAEPGQKIKIELVDFGGQTSLFNNDCPRNYGHIVSSDSEKDIVEICGGTTRIKQVHLSSTSQVQIMINPTAAQDYRFLLKYEAIGCRDVVPPRNAWFKKDGAGVTVGCHASTETWQLKCVGKHWIGFMGNCSKAAMDAPVTTEKTGFNSDHVISVAIGSLALVICCITVTIGVYCVKRHQYKSSYSENGNYVVPIFKGSTHTGNTIYTKYRPTATEGETDGQGAVSGAVSDLADLNNSVATGYSFQRPSGAQTLTAVQVHAPPLQAVQVHQRPLAATHVRHHSAGGPMFATQIRQPTGHIRQASTGGAIIATTHARQPSIGGGGVTMMQAQPRHPSNAFIGHARQPSTGGEAQRILALQAAANNNLRSRTMAYNNSNSNTAAIGGKNKPDAVTNSTNPNGGKGSKAAARTLPPPLPQRPANQPPLRPLDNSSQSDALLDNPLIRPADNSQSDALLDNPYYAGSNTNTGPVTGESRRGAGNTNTRHPPSTLGATDASPSSEQESETSTLLSNNRPRGVHSPDGESDENDPKYYVLDQPEPIYRTLEIHPTLNSDPED